MSWGQAVANLPYAVCREHLCSPVCHGFQAATMLSSPATPPLFRILLTKIDKQVRLKYLSDRRCMVQGNHQTFCTWKSNERFRLASHLGFPLMHVGYNLHLSHTFT